MRLRRICCRAVRDRLQQHSEFLQRQPRQLADIQPGKRDRQRLATQTLALTQRAHRTDHVARDTLLDHRALGGRERVQHVALRAGKRAVVAGVVAALDRLAGLRRAQVAVHGHHRLLIGEEDPVALLLRQFPPGNVDVVAQRDQDVALVLAVPRRRPGGDRALADAQGVVRDHRAFAHLMHAAQPVAARTCTLRRVGRKPVRIDNRLPGRIVAGAGIEHAQRVGHRGDAAHRGTRARRATLLLQRDRRWQAIDGVHVRHARLVDQPARIGRNRVQITPLGLGVERAKSERGLARARHAGEHHQRVARNVDIDVLQVVLAGAAHPDETLVPAGRGRAQGRRLARTVRADRVTRHRVARFGSTGEDGEGRLTAS